MKVARKTDRTPENAGREAGYLLRPATLGFLNGYFILHPAAMVIFRLLEGTHHPAGSGDLSRVAWQSIVHSFQLGMLPMGLEIGANFRRNCSKPNHVDVSALCKLFNNFSIEIFGP